MFRTNRLTFVALLIALFGMANLAAAERLPQPAVRVGVDAPPFKVAKFVKGEPVKDLEAGQVYVMEFWATWCGPCIQAMPHITEIAQKFEGRATVIGVDVFEHIQDKSDEAILALVEPFVTEKGDKMGYRVAIDGAAELMTANWMRAAGQSGIPCTFIINKDKKIAWIGHPMRMEKVLEQVIDGTWDIKAAAAEATKEWERQQEIKEVLDPVTLALRGRDYPALVVAIDNAIAKLPDVEDQLRPVKFDALVRTDEPAAYAYMKECIKNGVFEKAPVEAYNFWIAMNRSADSLKNPDWTTLTDILTTAAEAREGSYTIMVALADVYAKQSKFDKAVELQKKAIEATTDGKSTVPASWIELQKKKLAEYQSKL